MPRGREDMQVNVAGLRRNIKNIAHNYSDAQVKVREATSNDPWGPSSTLMAEIADLTYNVMAFTEIMQMIWKRLNDHGKNWRHVYKALVLMEYLIKTGSEKVAMQCKENIYAIQTLEDFQYTQEGKDQGLSVREKARQLVNLLTDDDRLKNERARALKAKQRFAQSTTAFGSDTQLETPTSHTYPTLSGNAGNGGVSGVSGDSVSSLARPLTAGEEELQLQLALAMSREEAERDERRRRSDDVRLQLAISQSQNDFQTEPPKPEPQQSHLLDLLDVSLSPTTSQDPWGIPPAPARPLETSSNPWSGVNSPAKDPWAPVKDSTDPWAPAPAPALQGKSPAQLISSPSSELSDFDAITNRDRVNGNNGHMTSPDPFDLSILDQKLPAEAPTAKKSPRAFLGENSALVNLDSLLQPPEQPAASALNHNHNPFAEPAPPPPRNHMFVQPQPRVTMNELKQQASDPWAPARHTPNPFLS